MHLQNVLPCVDAAGLHSCLVESKQVCVDPVVGKTDEVVSKVAEDNVTIESAVKQKVVGSYATIDGEPCCGRRYSDRTRGPVGAEKALTDKGHPPYDEEICVELVCSISKTVPDLVYLPAEYPKPTKQPEDDIVTVCQITLVLVQSHVESPCLENTVLAYEPHGDIQKDHDESVDDNVKVPYGSTTVPHEVGRCNAQSDDRMRGTPRDLNPNQYHIVDEPVVTQEQHVVTNNVVTEDSLEDSATIMYDRCGNHYLMRVLVGGHVIAVDASPGKENAVVHHSEPDDDCLGDPELSVKALGDKKAASGSTILKKLESEDLEATKVCTVEVVQHALSDCPRSLIQRGPVLIEEGNKSIEEQQRVKTVSAQLAVKDARGERRLYMCSVSAKNTQGVAR